MDDANKLVEKLKPQLGLERWTIAVGVGRTERLGINDGFATTDGKYRNAVIDLAPDLEPERLVHVVYHEMLHVALAEFRCPLVLFAQSLPRAQGEYLLSLLDYQEERLIEQLVPGLIELIEE